MRRRTILIAAVLATVVLLGGGPPAAAEPRLPSPAQWPLAGAVRLLAGFDPPGQTWGAGHRGIDLAASPGQPVLAAADGSVSYAGRLAGRGVVVVDHGGVRTTYEPVDPLVAVGERVAAGAVLGRIGRGGHCAQTCLHWGLKDGERYLDPLLLIPGGGGGTLRLLPADQVAVARKRAAERKREAAEAGAAVARIADVAPGKHSFGRPVPGGITSPFGMRLHPVLHVWKLHDGTDFGAACGTPIRAPYPGRVASVGFNRGYGNRLMLDHGVVDGHRVRTGYNHAIRYVVTPGTEVRRGQLLGYVGSTGYATGCHLHLMLWLDERLANPMVWF
ncbi:M23 family metallopeptidase [Microlunatus ginsengisoli]|uniref:M23 family metallopeptidase n=1 Tax=Microlunatus ginsengisoli TaxID=363863 RepID=UPI0031D8119E